MGKARTDDEKDSDWRWEMLELTMGKIRAEDGKGSSWRWERFGLMMGKVRADDEKGSSWRWEGFELMIGNVRSDDGKGLQIFFHLLTSPLLPLSDMITLFIWLKVRHWLNAGSMLGQRRRQWTNIDPPLGRCLIFAELDIYPVLFTFDSILHEIRLHYITPSVVPQLIQHWKLCMVSVE